MRLALVTVAAGTLLGLTAAASADAIVTLPFSLNTTAGNSASVTSAAVLDAAAGYTWSIEITEITLHANLFGPVNLNPLAFGDVTPDELVAAGAFAAMPSTFYNGHFDSSGSLTFPNGFSFDVLSEALPDGTIRATLQVNSLSAYSHQAIVPTNVTVTGTAIAQAVPVPAPAAAAAFLGLGGLALRRRR